MFLFLLCFKVLHRFVTAKRPTKAHRHDYRRPPQTTSCVVQFAHSPQGPLRIRCITGSPQALDAFLEREPTTPPTLPTRVDTCSTQIKRSSSAQAPTRAKLQAVAPSISPPKGDHHGGHPPSSPARLSRRPHNDLLQIILEEGDPDRDSIQREGPYTSLVPPTSPWNILGRDMIGVHTPPGSIISPTTLISFERCERLHAAHSQRAQLEAFIQDLLKILARYHPRAKSLNPQGR